MSQITLKPLDDGQSAVVIPLGKTTIGRGSLLGCSDKKVSRNHAVLEVTSKGEVYLTPTHVNPCFYQPSADNPGQILKKDVPHKLEHGDSFSLLPRAYRYQLSVIDKDTPPQNDLNKGKTNGSAGDSLEDLHKEPAKGVSSVEPTDTATPEKLKSDSPVDNKKPPSSKDDLPKRPSPPRSSEDNPKKKDKSPSPPSLKENNLPHKKEDKEEEEEDSNDDGEEAKAEDDSSNHLEKEEEDKKSEDKVEDKKDEDIKEEDKAESCEESRDEGTLDTLPSKVSEEEEEGSKPAKRGGRKKAAPKPPKVEKKSPVKRKAGGGAPRGRKKKSLASRFDFGPGEEGNSSQRVAERSSSRTNRQTRQGLSLEDFVVSDDDEWQSDHSSPKRRRKKRGPSRRNEDSGSDWEVDRKKPKKSIGAKGGSGSESGSDWGGSPKKAKGAPKGRRRKGKAAAESEEVASDGEEEPEVAAPSSSVPKTRTPCTHGKKCYRRNQNHVDQFSHPGDSDYASEGEGKAEGEEEAEPVKQKKECPYGANCFRKNAQHKKDFKHTKKGRPQRKAAEDKKGKGSKSDEVVDSYDLNDSLLNDESADEYKAPVDSGSDYEHGEKAKKLATKGRGGARGGKRGRKA